MSDHLCKFTAKDRHRHEVLVVAQMLAGTATGAFVGLQYDQLAYRRAWLRWRIDGGWTKSLLPMSVKFDESVRAVAREALALFEAECGADVDRAVRNRGIDLEAAQS